MTKKKLTNNERREAKRVVSAVVADLQTAAEDHAYWLMERDINDDDLPEIRRLLKVAIAAVRADGRKPNPDHSDYPTYPNPHPNGVTAEWVNGKGWVRVHAGGKVKR